VYATSANGVRCRPQRRRRRDPVRVDVAGGARRHRPSDEPERGASAPVDLLAAKLIDRAGIRSIVLDGTNPEVVVDAVLRGDHTGTDVIPTGSEEPIYWTGSSDA